MKTFLAGTPRPLKFIVYLIVGSSLFFALFGAFPIVKTLGLLLTISPLSAKHLMLWQLLTHAFYFPAVGGIQFGFLLNLFISAYMLLFTGKLLIEMRSLRHFYIIFFGSTFLSGLAAMVYLHFFPIATLFTGLMSVIFALLISWLFLFPDAQVLLFFMISVRTKWLIPGFIAFESIQNFSTGNFLGFVTTGSTLLFAYLYNVLAFRAHSPYYALHGFENRLMKLRKNPQVVPNAESFAEKSKIYDFKTGKAVLNDETFMDACLEKISQHGKKSLTFWERWRLKRIAKKRQERPS